MCSGPCYPIVWCALVFIIIDILHVCVVAPVVWCALVCIIIDILHVCVVAPVILLCSVH